MWPLLALLSLCARAGGAGPASVELWVGERRFVRAGARQECGVRPPQSLRVRCAGAGPAAGAGPLSYQLYLRPAVHPPEPPAPRRTLAESAAPWASATLALGARDADAALTCLVDDALAGMYVNVTVHLYDETKRVMTQSGRWRVAVGSAAGALVLLGLAAWGCAAYQRRRARQEFSSVAYADRNSVENLDPRTRPGGPPPGGPPPGGPPPGGPPPGGLPVTPPAPTTALDPQRLIYAEICHKIVNNNKKLRGAEPAVVYSEVSQRDC